MYQKLLDALSTYYNCPRMSMWMMTMTGGALLLLFGGIAYTLGGLIFTPTAFAPYVANTRPR